MLLFGKDRLRHFPDSYIKAGLFDGTDRRRILDSTDFQSMLPTAVDDALAFVGKQLRREIVIGRSGSARHAEKWTVPEAAVREAIVNASYMRTTLSEEVPYGLPFLMIVSR